MAKSKTFKPLEGEVLSENDPMKAMILSVVFGNIKKEVKRNPDKALEMLDELRDRMFEIMGIDPDVE